MPTRRPRDVAGQRRLEIRHRHRRRGRIPRVVPGHRAQQDRRVAHRPGHRSGMVERGGVGDDPPARAAAVGRLQPDDAAESSPAGGSSRRYRCRSRRARRAPRPPPPSRPTSRRGPAAGCPVPPPRVLDRAVIARRARRAHRELVEIGLAEHHRAGLPQFLGHGRFVGRVKPVEDVRPGGGQDALGAEQVLDRDRDAVERQRLAARQPFVGGIGHRQSALRRRGNIGVERLGLGDRIVIGDGQFSRRERLAGKPVACLGESKRQQRRFAHSTTLSPARGSFGAR